MYLKFETNVVLKLDKLMEVNSKQFANILFIVVTLSVSKFDKSTEIRD